MQIILNGKGRVLGEGTTLAMLVATFAEDTRAIAIELNREIVPKSEYAQTVLQAGDKLEVVQFVGGG